MASLVLSLGLLSLPSAIDLRLSRFFIDSVDKWLSANVFLAARLPDKMDTISILKLIENAIAANHNKVVLVTLNLKCSHIWISNHNPIISVQLAQLRLYVSKRTTY